jgi:hypothetical protein
MPRGGRARTDPIVALASCELEDLERVKAGVALWMIARRLLDAMQRAEKLVELTVHSP